MKDKVDKVNLLKSIAKKARDKIAFLKDVANNKSDKRKIVDIEKLDDLLESHFSQFENSSSDEEDPAGK